MKECRSGDQDITHRVTMGAAAVLCLLLGSCSGCPENITCGDGVPEGLERCDDKDRNSDAWSATRHCNANCSGYAPYCGDATKNGLEICDEGDVNGQPDHCKSDCSGIPPTGPTESRMCPYR